MFTNLYRPFVGGVPISVERFSRAYRQAGHDVLIVAPDFPGQTRGEDGVVRVSALQQFNGTDFAMALRPGLDLTRRLDEFRPDLVHSHHPFLLGASAARAATSRDLPLVFTHHTMYEYYTHYVPLDCKVLRNYVVQLSTRYTEFCDLLFAPSESVAGILRKRGVKSPIEVVPTGVVIEEFAGGDRSRGRTNAGIDKGCFVIGHVGRLQEEKNLRFLTRSVIRAMKRIEGSRFLVVGAGDMEEEMRGAMEDAGLGNRAVFAGKRTGSDLADLYAAMDVFVFSSKSETQGMVLVEALAARTPLVALDAPGAREAVRDGQNGRLVTVEGVRAFARAVEWIAGLDADTMDAMRDRARIVAETFSLDRCVDKALAAYRRILTACRRTKKLEGSDWDRLLESIRREWEIWSNRAASLTAAISFDGDPKDRPRYRTGPGGGGE